MSPYNRIYLLFLAGTLLIISGCQGYPTILNPKGIVAFEERKILFDTTALMLIVVIPVIIMSLDFITHYRSTNTRAEYKPNWCHSVMLESIWWGIPCAIIFILAIITWVSTHKLDPFRKLAYPGEVKQIEVIALPWKWLFIYPEENIALVNKLVLPKKQQVEFLLTSDNVPMSAFFIPQLGSQIYTMAGMRTRLHLIPTHTGKMQGMNTQFNGDGFADMRFNVKVMTKNDYSDWVSTMKNNTQVLNHQEYANLRNPSILKTPRNYTNVDTNLFKDVIASYKHENHPTW